MWLEYINFLKERQAVRYNSFFLSFGDEVFPKRVEKRVQVAD